MKTTKKYFAKFLALVAILILIPSCVGDYLDTDRIATTGFEISPTLSAPLVNGTITIGDYTDEIEFLTFDTVLIDGIGYERLKLVFEMDALEGFSAGGDIFNMDVSQSITYGLDQITMDDIPGISSEITFQQIIENSSSDLSFIAMADGGSTPIPPIANTDISGQYGPDPMTEFEKVVFESGTYSLDITNKLPMPVDVSMQMFTEIDGVAYPLKTFSFTDLASGESASDNLNLAGLAMGNVVYFENLNFSSPGTGVTAVDINLATQQLEISSSATNLVVKSGTAEVPEETYAGSEVIEIDLGAGYEVDEMRLKSGGVDLSITNPFGFDLVLDLTFDNVLDDANQVVGIHTTIAAGATVNETIDFTNTTTTLTQGATSSEIAVSYDVTINPGGGLVAFDAADKMAMDFSMTFGLSDIEHVLGYLGQETIDVPEDVIEVPGLDMLDMFTGDFTLTDPKITIDYTNPLGLPIDLEFDVVGEDADGNTVPLNIGKATGGIIALEYPTVIGQSVSSQIIVDKNTSDIVDFMAALPRTITYSGSVVTNPDGNTGTQNFVTGDIDISLGMSFELPLALKSNNFGFRDTFAMEGIELPADIDFESFELSANISNGFPFDFGVTLTFLDTTNVNDIELFTLQPVGGGLLLTAPDVDEFGHVIESTITKQLITFAITKDMFEKLPNMTHVIFEAAVSTPNDGADMATIYNDYKIDFELFIQNAKITIGF